jgi:hypothetical protein
MSGFAGDSFRERISTAARWLCTRLAEVSPALYRARMRALALLAHDEPICCALLDAAGKFPAFIVAHLTDSDPQTMHINWAFFSAWTAHTSVLSELLASPAGAGLQTIVSSESNAVLKHFFRWAINVWRTRGPAIVAQFCEIMMPTIGRVTGMFRRRRSRFQGDDHLVQLIEEYAKAIAELTAPGAERFMETFGKHMDPKDVPASRLGWMRFRQNTQRLLSAAIEKELL